MLNSYQAVIENGQLHWIDTPPTVGRAEVIVTVLPSNSVEKGDSNSECVESTRYDYSKPGEKRMGFMVDENFSIPDDFNKYDDEILEIFGID